MRVPCDVVLGDTFLCAFKHCTHFRWGERWRLLMNGEMTVWAYRYEILFRINRSRVLSSRERRQMVNDDFAVQLGAIKATKIKPANKAGIAMMGDAGLTVLRVAFVPY